MSWVTGDGNGWIGVYGFLSGLLLYGVSRRTCRRWWLCWRTEAGPNGVRCHFVFSGPVMCSGLSIGLMLLLFAGSSQCQSFFCRFTSLPVPGVSHTAFPCLPECHSLLRIPSTTSPRQVDKGLLDTRRDATNYVQHSSSGAVRIDIRLETSTSLD